MLWKSYVQYITICNLQYICRPHKHKYITISTHISQHAHICHRNHRKQHSIMPNNNVQHQRNGGRVKMTGTCKDSPSRKKSDHHLRKWEGTLKGPSGPVFETLYCTAYFPGQADDIVFLVVLQQISRYQLICAWFMRLVVANKFTDNMSTVSRVGTITSITKTNAHAAKQDAKAVGGDREDMSIGWCQMRGGEKSLQDKRDKDS